VLNEGLDEAFPRFGPMRSFDMRRCEVKVTVRTFLSVMLLLAGAALANAQSFDLTDIEYANNLCELRSENRVFVHAPLNTRQELVNELRKHSDLVIVERPEEAEFFIMFAYSLAVADSPSALGLANAGNGGAEMAVLKYVSNQKDGKRPRILSYWSGKESIQTFPLPFTSISSAGFAGPRSGKSALGEVIARFALWFVGKKSKRFEFDQFTNQLTINMGGKLERQGAKAFLRELKSARSSSYANRCMDERLASSSPRSPQLSSDPLSTLSGAQVSSSTVLVPVFRSPTTPSESISPQWVASSLAPNPNAPPAPSTTESWGFLSETTPPRKFEPVLDPSPSLPWVAPPTTWINPVPSNPGPAFQPLFGSNGPPPWPMLAPERSVIRPIPERRPVVVPRPRSPQQSPTSSPVRHCPSGTKNRP
jgi:hypothetical protein